MDVYGYHSYQYNQSDELAKQLYAQQALATSLPYTQYSREVERHTMPAPSGAPWNAQGLPWGMTSPPQLVQFTAQTTTTDSLVCPVVHCKRKSLDVEPAIPAKQLITEEKMAAHLNSLHISSDYTPHTSSMSASEELMDVGMEPCAAITEKLKGRTIVISEEVKKLREEPILPAALIERLEKPRMSLVLWKPKENILEKLKEIDEKEESKEEHEPTKRNGVLVPELPGMDVEM